MTLSESPHAQACREFNGTECPGCQGPKKPANGFCSRCYFALPKDLQRALWKRFGAGYEEAHEDARDWLQQERRAAQ